VSAAAGLRCRPPHFVLTVCQCEPSACFTRGVRLLLIIITLTAQYWKRYSISVNRKRDNRIFENRLTTLVQVTASGRQTVPDWGVVRSCDPLQNYGAPVISLERLNLKSSIFVVYTSRQSILCNRMTYHQQKCVVMVT